MRAKNFYSTLFLTFLLAGTLDMLSAIMLNHNVPAERICRYIASGVFGTAAFTGGNEMVVWGLAFHYLIAYAWTATWFILYPAFVKLLKNPVITGIVFGLITWGVMNFLVVPFTHTPKPKGGMSTYGIAVNIAALVICIGIPVALIANWYYYKRRLPVV